MTDVLKEKIIIRAIKCYKNREEWEDEYVQEQYSDAIEYMMEYFDKYFPSASSNSSMDNIPTGARIKKIQQGGRAIEYDYGNSSTETSTAAATVLNAMIEKDVILSALLGLPLMRCM